MEEWRRGGKGFESRETSEEGTWCGRREQGACRRVSPAGCKWMRAVRLMKVWIVAEGRGGWCPDGGRQRVARARGTVWKGEVPKCLTVTRHAPNCRLTPAAQRGVLAPAAPCACGC
jgi:hypothetical protein